MLDRILQKNIMRRNERQVDGTYRKGSKCDTVKAWQPTDPKWTWGAGVSERESERPLGCAAALATGVRWCARTNHALTNGYASGGHLRPAVGALTEGAPLVGEVRACNPRCLWCKKCRAYVHFAHIWRVPWFVGYADEMLEPIIISV